MKLRHILTVSAVCLASNAYAGTQSHQELLPSDTLAIMTVPDYAAAQSAWKEQAYVQLWHDAKLQPFREKFEAKWQKTILDPLEQRLGVSFTDQARLLQGQITAAIVANGWPKTTGRVPAWLIIVDVGSHAPLLTERFAEWKSRLTGSEQPARIERLLEHEFLVMPLAGAAFRWPGAQRPAATGESEIWCGQSGSLLWVGDSRDVIEQAMGRQAGKENASLASNGDFVAAFASNDKTPHVSGWLHVKPLVDFLSTADLTSGSSEGGAMSLLPPSKVLSALGLRGLRTLSFNIHAAAAGTTAEMRFGIPQQERTGLFKMIVPAPREASPPPFVSDDTTRFQRLRVDLQTAWKALEDAVYSVLPTARSVVDLMFQSVGKDKDPNYDLRRELIGNLGDDIILVEHRPLTNDGAALAAAPSLILVAATSPERVARAIEMVTALLPPPMNVLRRSQVTGRTIYSMTLSDSGSGSPASSFSFGAGDGYLAMSSDLPLLQQFLSASPASEKPLSDAEGLREAAAAVGGMNSGWFGYDNDRAMAQSIINALRQDSTTLEQVLTFSPAGEMLAKSGGLKAWTDMELLPPFQEIAHYFHFTVYGLQLGPEAFTYKMFSPTPPDAVASK